MIQAYLMGRFIGLFEGLSDDEDNVAVTNGASVEVGSASISSNVSNPGSSFQSSESSIERTEVYILIPLIAVVYLASVFLDHNFFHHGYRMRVATTSLIYRKVMRLIL